GHLEDPKNIGSLTVTEKELRIFLVPNKGRKPLSQVIFNEGRCAKHPFRQFKERSDALDFGCCLTHFECAFIKITVLALHIDLTIPVIDFGECQIWQVMGRDHQKVAYVQPYRCRVIYNPGIATSDMNTACACVVTCQVDYLQFEAGLTLTFFSKGFPFIGLKELSEFLAQGMF